MAHRYAMSRKTATSLRARQQQLDDTETSDQKSVETKHQEGEDSRKMQVSRIRKAMQEERELKQHVATLQSRDASLQRQADFLHQRILQEQGDTLILL